MVFSIGTNKLIEYIPLLYFGGIGTYSVPMPFYCFIYLFFVLYKNKTSLISN